MSSVDDPIARVASGYDKVGDEYFKYYRTDPSEVVTRYEDLFIDQVTAGGSVLELGCGNGLPTAARLHEKFELTGVDFSAGQIERARQNVPGPTFIHADMTKLEFSEASFGGFAALYSVIHVPREFHGDLFRSIYAWLKPGGIFMTTLNSSEDSGNYIDDWFGAPMFWSGFDVDTSRQMITDTGFETISDRVEVSDDPNSDHEKEIHLWVVARKPQ